MNISLTILRGVIGAHNETLSVAMRVYNPDRSPLHIHG